MGGWRHPWLVKRAREDCTAGATASLPANRTAELWLVHGKWYDLSGWAPSHPGGSWWLEQTRGMDITDLVETHHFDTGAVDAVLARHCVGEAPAAYRPFFDFEEGGLFRTLKRRVTAALSAVGGGSGGKGSTVPLRSARAATAGFLWQCRLVLLAHVALFAWTARSGSLLGAAFTGVTISSLHGIGHNFIHQADAANPWRYAAVAGGWKVHLQRISHAISHHPRPNTFHDLEILGLEPFLFNMVCSPRNHPAVALYGPLLCASAHLLDVLLLWWRMLRGATPVRLECFSNALQLLLLCCCGASHGAARGALCFAAMFLVFGAIDSFAGFPLHHTERAWTEGNTHHARKRDLAEHIVASTVDYDVGSMGSWQSLLCFELMPNHCLHHCFPTLDCSRFDTVRPVFEATLREFGVRQQLLPQPAVYFGMWPAWLRGISSHRSNRD